MLPIELLSERFKNEFKLRWPFSNSPLEIEWTRHEQALYFRVKNAPTDAIWMCAGGASAHNYEKPVSILSTALKHKRVWRYYRFQGQSIFLNCCEGIISSPTGKSILSRPPQLLGAAFQLPTSQFPDFQKPHKCLLASSELLDTGLGILLADESSGYNMAQRWLHEYDDWSIIDWDETTKLKIEKLLRGLYWLYAMDEKEFPYGISLFRHGQNNSVLLGSHTPRFKAPQKLFDVINRHFPLHFVSCRRSYHSGTWSKPTDYFPTLHFPQPTMHEKLEALFLWQEFLADKLPQDEIEAILPSW